MPTSTKANSLTTDSKAIAIIIPRLLSRRCPGKRVPNRMANIVIKTAAKKAASKSSGLVVVGEPAIMLNVWPTAFNCSAM